MSEPTITVTTYAITITPLAPSTPPVVVSVPPPTISGGGGGGGVSDHGALTGLSDHDHPQYVRNDAAQGLASGAQSQARANIGAEAAGAAAAALASHTAAGDPHPGYATDGELASEATARTTADAALDGRVDALELAPPAHQHPLADVAGLQAALDGKAPASHQHAAGEIASGTIAAARLPAASETAAGIVELATGAETTAGLAVQASDPRLSDARTPTAHSHAISDTTGLQAALDGKAPASHSHAIADTTGLQAALDGKLATAASGDFATAGHGHANATTSAAGFLGAADKNKLDGVASGATANATDAQLRDRSTHTGSQAASTISDLAEAVDDRVAALLQAGANVTLTYNDGAGTLTIDATNVREQITDYTTAGSHTYSIPSWARTLECYLVGGGGGGGSGRRGATNTNRGGGGGGCGGAYSPATFRVDLDIGASTTLDVVVGAAGTGGAARTTDDTDGANGVGGGASSIALPSSYILVQAGGGGQGGQGTTSAGSAGSVPSTGVFLPSAGGAGNFNAAGAAGGTTQTSAGSGGGGGGIDSSNTVRAGGIGGRSPRGYRDVVGGAGGAANGGAGGSHSAPATGPYPGGGGGGGGGNNSGAAGSGGNGSFPGGGGGGGGASLNGNNSGAGGNGGAGFVRIIARP